MSKRILVIEDQEDNRRIMRDLLTSVGYEIIEALTGEDGVTAAASHVPDLILMDIQLPGLDGYEATRRIKANPALQHIPIIAVTSYALSGDDVKAFEAGCNGYVSKPFSPRAPGQDSRILQDTVLRHIGKPTSAKLWCAGPIPSVRRDLRTPPRILIVDDQPMNVDILQTRLGVHGYGSSPPTTAKRWPRPGPRCRT